MRVFIVVGALGVLVACPSPKEDNPTEGMEVTAKPTEAKTMVEAPAATAMRTVETTPELVEKGKGLFLQCTGCHGVDGKGTTGTGPSLNSESFLTAASDQFLFNTIKDGRQGTTMIPWGASLKDDDINAIIAYVRSLTPTEAAELDESPLKGDAEAGEQIFSSICAACHGRSGAGYQETANGTGIGRAVFLKTASNGYLRYIIGKGKDQTKMRGFSEGSKVAVANLEPKQIEDVITYLRTSAW